MFENKYFTKQVIKDIRDNLHIPDALIDELKMLKVFDTYGIEKTIVEHNAFYEMDNIINESIDHLLQKYTKDDISNYINGGRLSNNDENLINNLIKLKNKSEISFKKSKGSLHILRKNTWYILNEMYNDSEIDKKKINILLYKELLNYLIENYSYSDTLKNKGYNDNLEVN